MYTDTDKCRIKTYISTWRTLLVFCQIGREMAEGEESFREMGCHRRDVNHDMKLEMR